MITLESPRGADTRCNTWEYSFWGATSLRKTGLLVTCGRWKIDLGEINSQRKVKQGRRWGKKVKIQFSSWKASVYDQEKILTLSDSVTRKYIEISIKIMEKKYQKRSKKKEEGRKKKKKKILQER